MQELRLGVITVCIAHPHVRPQLSKLPLQEILLHICNCFHQAHTEYNRRGYISYNSQGSREVVYLHSPQPLPHLEGIMSDNAVYFSSKQHIQCKEGSMLDTG